MTIDPARIEEIFSQAAELDDPAARASLLDQACGDDAALRERVEALLAAHDSAHSFMCIPDESQEWTVILSPLSEGPGTKIGRYKLLEQIGEGGFGVVFMAEQERPVRRRVALKIIKAGMDTKQVVARFEAERQALAMMEHPNIARVLDAGATETGRPYFVMELVQGVPMTAYCDQCNLTTQERLELFVTVCQAVQHAHQKGVIHRDIKPTNVLVAIQDGRPAPKIIDFGVAKAINQQLTEHTLMTSFAQIVGTPLYMSPEQAELSPLGVDTRTDIYSLGALLYELLTSTTPFDKELLHAAPYDELRRIIREEEPPLPSARISTLAAGHAGTIAVRRRTDMPRLQQAVRGELDWIVMKCLEKDRNRRYETAGSLARDVERFLHDEPVQACPPSASYRVRKFIRRNKVGVVAGSAVVLAIFAGLALGTAGFVQARKQARISAAEASKAKAISELLQSALQSANPDQAKGPDYTVRQLLDDFAGSLADQLVGQPEAEAQLRATIGNAYRRLGLFDLAGPQFETALALRRRIGGTDDASYADVLVDYAQNLAEQVRINEAERTAREAIDIYRRAGTTGQSLVKALWILQLQLAYRMESMNEEAAVRSASAEEQAVVDEALAIARANGMEYPELANMLHRHAPLLSRQGAHEEAEAYARRAVEMHRRVHGDQHPETAYGLADLGRVLRDRKKYSEAAGAYRQALDIFRNYYGDRFPVVVNTRGELQLVLRHLREASDQEPRQPGPDMFLSHDKQSGQSMPADRALRLAQEALERELRDAIKSFDDDSVATSHDRERLLTKAATYRQFAELNIKRDKLDEAIGNLNSALSISARLVEQVPSNYTYAQERARCQFRLTETLARAERSQEFLAAFAAGLDMNDEAILLFPSQISSWPLNPDACVPIVHALQHVAREAPEMAEHSHLLFQRGMDQLKRLHLVSAVEMPLETANIYVSILPILAADSQWKHHTVDLERQLTDSLQMVLTNYPDSAFARMQVAHMFRYWGFLIPWTNEFVDSAERAFQAAIRTFEELVADFVDSPRAWHFLADTHRVLGELYEQQGRSADAEASYRRATELFDAHTGPERTDGEQRATSYLGFAALLARTDRSSEADEYSRKGFDILENSVRDEPDVVQGYARAACLLTKSGLPPRATEMVRKAQQYAQRSSDPTTSATALYYIALAQVRLEDLSGYRETCQAMTDLPVSTIAETDRWRSALTLCLGPDSVKDMRQILSLAEEFAEAESLVRPFFANYVLGIAYYRAGKYEQADKCLEQAIATYPSVPPLRGDDVINYQRLILAMTKWQLGDHDAARTLWTEILPAVDNEARSPLSYWNRRTTLEIFRREAEALIGPDPPNHIPVAVGSNTSLLANPGP